MPPDRACGFPRDREDAEKLGLSQGRSCSVSDRRRARGCPRPIAGACRVSHDLPIAEPQDHGADSSRLYRRENAFASEDGCIRATWNQARYDAVAGSDCTDDGTNRHRVDTVLAVEPCRRNCGAVRRRSVEWIMQCSDSWSTCRNLNCRYCYQEMPKTGKGSSLDFRRFFESPQVRDHDVISFRSSQTFLTAPSDSRFYSSWPMRSTTAVFPLAPGLRSRGYRSALPINLVRPISRGERQGDTRVTQFDD